MSSIPLPALDLRPQQSADPLQSIGRLIEMKSLLNSQQMQAGQLQLQQQQIKDQQALTNSLRNWDPSKQSYDDLAHSVIQNGGSGNAALQIQQHALSIKKTVSDIAAQDATTGSKNLETFIGKQKAIGNLLEAHTQVPDEQLHDWTLGQIGTLSKNGILDPQHAQQLSQAVQQTQDPQQLRSLIDQAGKSALGAQQVAEQEKIKQEGFKAEQEGKKAQQETAFYQQNPAAGAPGVPAETVSLMDYMRKPQQPGEAMHTPANYPAWKAKQEAIATLPEKAELAKIETQTAQLIKGMAEPGYAFDPQTGETKLTDKTAYLQSGGKMQAFRPVGEKDVREDTMLTNRLADVHQKIAEYEQALQKPVNSKDQGNMAALLGTEGFKLGVSHTEIPMDRLNAALQRENLSKLSANARDQIVAFKNAREAMMGYKTVLSGSARGSDKSMDLLTQALPDPSYTDPDFSKRSLDAFKQNLHVVGQGLPTLPGIKNPQQIEQEVWGNQAPSGGNSKANDPLGIR